MSPLAKRVIIASIVIVVCGGIGTGIYFAVESAQSSDTSGPYCCLNPSSKRYAQLPFPCAGIRTFACEGMPESSCKSHAGKCQWANNHCYNTPSTVTSQYKWQGATMADCKKGPTSNEDPPGYVKQIGAAGDNLMPTGTSTWIPEVPNWAVILVSSIVGAVLLFGSGRYLLQRSRVHA